VIPVLSWTTASPSIVADVSRSDCSGLAIRDRAIGPVVPCG